MSARIKLEPIGRHALLVAAVHAALGLGIWWWWHSHQSQVQHSSGEALVWMSPSDFTTSIPAPAPVEPPKPTEIPKPSPVVAVTTPSMSPKAPDADDDDKLPKAIAIDPVKAVELMAKAMAAEQAAAAKSAMPQPAPTPAPPEPKPEPAKSSIPDSPVSTPSPTPKEPGKSPVTGDKPPPPEPATDVARIITVSHPVTSKPVEAPKVTSLLEIAALDASASGDRSGIRLDEVDRAIIDTFLRNWTPPKASKLPVDQRSAHMEVTMNREGRLLRFKLIRSSGSKELDDSVLEAGDRLDKIEMKLPSSYPHDLYELQVNFHVE